MRRVTKLFNTKATSIDDVNKSVSFTISDDQVDRMGEIVDQKSWDFKSYLKNPLLLWGHDPSEPENVLGTAASLNIAKDGHSTTADLTFDTAFNPKAALIYNQIKAGTLRTVSVGFIPHTEEFKDDTPVLKDNELLEISVVPLPANPRAIALSLKEGTISTKDAHWLMDSMRKEADLLETQLKEAPNEAGDKNVDELKGQIATLTEAVGKLTEAAAANNDKITELTEQLAEAKKEPEETPEQKSERDAKEKADQEAADKKAAEDEAAKKAEEDAKNNPAKGGSNDQPGAGESDDLDENAELTPELQAKIDAELELAA